MESEHDHEIERSISITIDDTGYKAPSHHMTGKELRALPDPDVPDNRDLWLEVPGPADDDLIRPDKTYTVKPGAHYSTAPSTINPGGL